MVTVSGWAVVNEERNVGRADVKQAWQKQTHVWLWLEKLTPRKKLEDNCMYHRFTTNYVAVPYRVWQLSKHSFIHSVFCLTTGPKPPQKRFLHIVRSRASSFKWEYPLLSLRLSSSFLRLLPRLLVTSVSSFTFPSITCFRRQFLRTMRPIQLAFRFLISCRIFLCSLTH